jgi:PST family polysaccharide transporter
MSVRRADSLFSSLCYLGAARATAVCMNLLATSRLAHALGAENFGINSFAASYVSYFIIVVNWGFDMFLTREIAANESRLHSLVSGVIAMRLVLAAGMFILLLGSISLLHSSATEQTVMLIQGANLFGSAIGLTCVYQGLQRMRMVAWREFMASVVNVVGILWLVHSPDDLVLAACIVVGTQVMTNFTILTRYASEFGIPRIRLPGRADLQVIWDSMSFFWSLLMITITYNTHIVMLGLIRSTTEVGLFSAGWKLFVFAVAVPNLISTLFLPRIANLMTQGTEWERSMELCLKTIIVCAIPTTIFGCLLTPQILTFLFGPAYLAASRTVVLLLMNGFVVSVNIGLGTLMLAMGRQNAFLRVVAVGAAIGVLANAILIPLCGGEGAAFATLVDEAVILGMLCRKCPDVLGPPVIDFTIRCVFAIIPAAGAVHLMRYLPLVAKSDLGMLIGSGVVGSIAYVLGLRLLRIDLRHFAADLRRLQ